MVNPNNKFIKGAAYALVVVAAVIFLVALLAILVVVVKGTIFIWHWKV